MMRKILIMTKTDFVQYKITCVMQIKIKIKKEERMHMSNNNIWQLKLHQ